MLLTLLAVTFSIKNYDGTMAREFSKLPSTVKQAKTQCIKSNGNLHRPCRLWCLHVQTLNLKYLSIKDLKRTAAETQGYCGEGRSI